MIGNNPVEHLDQERKFLQYPAMKMVGETRAVRGEQEHSTASPALGQVLRARGIVLPILIIRSICTKKFGG